MVSDRSAAGSTVVVAVAELFELLGSVASPETEAVFVTVPAWSAVTVIVTVACAPEASAPRLQVSVVVPEQAPCDAFAAAKLTLAGSGSVTVTPVAVLGPLFLTVRV